MIKQTNKKVIFFCEILNPQPERTDIHVCVYARFRSLLANSMGFIIKKNQSYLQAFYLMKYKEKNKFHRLSTHNMLTSEFAFMTLTSSLQSESGTRSATIRVG